MLGFESALSLDGNPRDDANSTRARRSPIASNDLQYQVIREDPDSMFDTRSPDREASSAPRALVS
jgi:hypothetical protein